jgi:hypothetical protein
MIQKQFADKVVGIIKSDKSIIGLAAAGSWITNEIDEFSDLDLILVTKNKITDDKEIMLEYANRFGKLLTGFTGEHVREPRVLICLYDDPLLHVDIKFVTLEEFHTRIEKPVILFDTDNQLQNAISNSKAKFPYPDYQWIEDRFWVWIHYIVLKIGRGEYFEALDGLSFIRSVVLGPLLLIKNEKLPRGVRKLESQLDPKELETLKQTIATHNLSLLFHALKNCVDLYRGLRKSLYDSGVSLQTEAEKRVIELFEKRAAMNKDFDGVSLPVLCDILAGKTLQLLKFIEQKKTSGKEYVQLKKEVQVLQMEIKKQTAGLKES